MTLLYLINTKRNWNTARWLAGKGDVDYTGRGLAEACLTGGETRVLENKYPVRLRESPGDDIATVADSFLLR